MKSRWQKLAKETLRRDASTLARDVLEEYLACFLTDEELISLGLPTLAGRRPGPLISVALRECGEAAERPRRSRLTEDTQELLATALQTIMDRAPTAIVEEMARKLTDLAGRYGEERELSPQRTPKGPDRGTH